MLQQKFIVQVTTLPDCDDITRFDGIRATYAVAIRNLYTCCIFQLKACLEGLASF
jgi:hypothetical protein